MFCGPNSASNGKRIYIWRENVCHSAHCAHFALAHEEDDVDDDNGWRVVQLYRQACLYTYVNECALNINSGRRVTLEMMFEYKYWARLNNISK